MSEQAEKLEDQFLDYREEEASSIRKVIARRMLESKLSTPHFYLTVDLNIENTIKMRNELNANGNVKISFNDIIMKALAVVLKDHPECNVSYMDGKIRYYNSINICLAVAIEDGLLTPTIHECEKKSLLEINREAIILVEKARNKKLRLRESMGGTFTLSNLGMYGIEEFSAIINPPQALILAVGAIREVPVVEDGEMKIGKRMKMTLSCDHRAVDGVMCALFLSDLKKVLENPQDFMP